MFAPVAALKRASVRCEALPTPDVPSVICCFFDSATSSATLFACTELCSTIACGARLASPMATKSLSGS